MTNRIDHHYKCKQCKIGKLIDREEHHPCTCHLCEDWNGCYGGTGRTEYFHYCSNCKKEWSGSIRLRSYTYKYAYRDGFNPAYSSSCFDDLLKKKIEDFFKEKKLCIVIPTLNLTHSPQSSTCT